ncbi:hypothetical protein GQR58_002396 [Nymphon striatum]|nr:hypothetical protein GQR58_002396 [Nymphon striatum]
MPNTNQTDAHVASHSRLISGFRPPTSPDFEGTHVAENWKLFKRKWNNFSIISNLAEQSDDYQVAMLGHTLGDQGLKLLDGFSFSSDSPTVGEILSKFDQFAVGEINETYERFIFNNRDQNAGETFDTFLSAIRTLIKTCNYDSASQDSLIRDRIVLGILDKETQKLLLRERNLNLELCINICRSSENALTHGRAISLDPSINKISNSMSSLQHRKPAKYRAASKQPQASKECLFCGLTHLFRKDQCPAWGKTCNKCKNKNHFEAKCKLNNIHKIDEEPNSDSNSISGDDMWVNSVSNNPVKSNQIFCHMHINEQIVKFQIDTGAAVNLLPIKYVSRHDQIRPTSKRLKLWNDAPLKPIGVIQLDLLNPKNSKCFRVEFVVVKENFTPLLGLKTVTDMKLINVNYKQMDHVNAINVFDGFPDVFDGDLGSLPGVVSLQIDESISPVISAARRIPISLRPKLKTELDRLVKIGVISPVEEPTTWVNQIVIVEKKNSEIRICLDPRELNKALKREHFQLPILEDTLYNMTESRIFSKLDLSSGYWHIKLDKSSSFLTTFQTCYGRYRWNRLPFVSDMLSRAPLPDQPKSELVTVNLVNFSPVKPHMLQRIKSETANDEVLCILMMVIGKGWPEGKEVTPSCILPYFDYRDELSVMDGIIMRGDRVVIPGSMRREMKEKVHAGHLGINSCVRRARDLLFWPGMSGDVRQYVQACHTCATFSDRQPPETLFLHEIPDHPWETVGSDIFTIKERSYLVTVDYYSGFFEIDFLLDTLSKTVITKLKHHFARHGIPIKFISDGGPQYTSELFKAFEIKWNFNHEYSSPGNSKANGAAEAAVKQAKRLLKKCVHSNEDPYIGLLNIRNTPTESLNSSPAQRLFCRRTRTMLPIVSSLLISDPMSKSEFKLKKEMRRNDIAVRENQTRHDLKPLLSGDKVVIEPYKRGDSHWHPATVHKAIKPRTYEVTTNDGRQIRRNRQQLRHKPNLDIPQSSPTISSKSLSNKPEHVLDSPTCSHPIVLSEPLNETSSNGSPDPYQTRFGRQIKPVQRLNFNTHQFFIVRTKQRNYGRRQKEVNNVRKFLFETKYINQNKSIDISLLPPCQASLRLHTLRSNVVARIWKLSDEAQIQMPDLSQHGWTINNSIRWIEKAFPDELEDLLLTEETETVYADDEESEEDNDSE